MLALYVLIKLSMHFEEILKNRMIVMSAKMSLKITIDQSGNLIVPHNTATLLIQQNFHDPWVTTLTGFHRGRLDAHNLVRCQSTIQGVVSL